MTNEASVVDRRGLRQPLKFEAHVRGRRIGDRCARLQRGSGRCHENVRARASYPFRADDTTIKLQASSIQQKTSHRAGPPGDTVMHSFRFKT